MTEPDLKRPTWQRLWPIYLIVVGLLVAWQFGLFKYLSLDTLRDQRQTLSAFVENSPILAYGAYIGIYALATLFMIPGALWLTIAGGFMFGLVGGTPATILGATLGACGLFLAAQTSIGKPLREKAGPWVKKMQEGFNEDALSYMFAIRFLPAIPFPIANIAPAILGAKFGQYALTTALGIIPGVLAYTWLGAGLGATFAAGETPDTSAVFRNLLPAFAALFIVSLLPIAYRKLFGRTAPAPIEDST